MTRVVTAPSCWTAVVLNPLPPPQPAARLAGKFTDTQANHASPCIRQAIFGCLAGLPFLVPRQSGHSRQPQRLLLHVPRLHASLAQITSLASMVGKGYASIAAQNQRRNPKCPVHQQRHPPARQAMQARTAGLMVQATPAEAAAMCWAKPPPQITAPPPQRMKLSMTPR